MQLNKSPKIFSNYKCDYPENTIKRIEDSFDRLGLSLEYKPIESNSGRFSVYSGYLILSDLGFATVGKGTSKILAKASAYAEMAERYSSAQFYFNTVTFDFIKYNNLMRDVLERKFLKGYLRKKNLTPEDIHLVSNYIEGGLSKEDIKIFKKQNLLDGWVDSYSFISGKYNKIPIKFVEMVSGTSGIAAGNTKEETLVQGICEIFERYATYKVLSDKMECPTVDISSLKDERIHNYIEMFKSMNVEVVIKDFTLNNKLPVMAVLFINHNFENDENEFKKDRYYKMIDVGSHNNLNEAILRCFTERLQELTKEEFVYRKKIDILFDFWTKNLKKKYNRVVGDLSDNDFFTEFEYMGDLSFLEKGEKVSLDKLNSSNASDFLDDFKELFNICNNNGWDLQVIDYTNKILNFPTFRVIIPPLSTTHHQWVLRVIKIKNQIDRFNFFYGTDDFFRYSLQSDKWIKNSHEVKKLITNLERFLSKNPSGFRIFMRLGLFHYPINLFHVLAVLNLSIGNYNEAIQYFNVLLQLNDRPSFYSSYFNALLNPGYNPSFYNSYINMVKNGLKNKNPPVYNLKSNPFYPKNCLTEFKPFFDYTLREISKSFFI